MLTFNQFVNESNQELNESYANLANILRGGRSSIHTVGILSAENPHGKKASDSENKKNTVSLKRYLTQARYGYRLVKGKYGSDENSIVINNISREDLLELGSRFEQDSVVFGKRVESKDGYYGMDFEMVGTDTHNFNEEMGTSRVMINRSNAEDFYTEYQGRKFVIPFFGTEDLSSELGAWDEVTSNDYSDTSWEGGTAAPSKSDRIYRNSKTGQEITADDFETLLSWIGESAVTYGSTSWNYRGAIKKMLNKK
jgi:hypothetical protein